MARCRRLSLFRREIKERVSPAGLELLLEAAERITEGEEGPAGRYFGSTMLTIDLDQAAELVSDACDVATARRLARLLKQEPFVVAVLEGIARSEAERITRRAMEPFEIDIRVTVEDRRIFIDIDVEGGAGARAEEKSG